MECRRPTSSAGNFDNHRRIKEGRAMFRIVFVSLQGGEREIVVAAPSRMDAVMTATTLKDFGLILTCTEWSSRSAK
jgi:hypothetical protein